MERERALRDPAGHPALRPRDRARGALGDPRDPRDLISFSSDSACATLGAGGRGTGLIVLGLMLGTTIVSAALVTGDTMSHTIRTTATAALGESDEVVPAKAAVDESPASSATPLGSGGSPSRWPRDRVDTRPRASSTAPRPPSSTRSRFRRPGRGRASLAPRSSRRTRPRWTASPRCGANGQERSLAQLAARRGVPERGRGGRARRAARRPRIAFLVGEAAYLKARDVVELDGAATGEAGVLVPLQAAQIMLRALPRRAGVMISNRGGGRGRHCPTRSRRRSSRR